MLIVDFNPLKRTVVSSDGEEYPLAKLLPLKLNERKFTSKPFDPCSACKGICLKDDMDCYGEHVVYIAAYSRQILKVGVTKKERLPIRLLEQGADAGFIVNEFSDGLLARKYEQEISNKLAIRDMVRAEEIAEGAFYFPDFSEFADFVRKYQPERVYYFEYFLPRLDQKPLKIRLKKGRIIGGTLVGNKGRIVLLEHGVYGWFSGDELVGWDVEKSEANSDIQTSLEKW